MGEGIRRGAWPLVARLGSMPAARSSRGRSFAGSRAVTSRPCDGTCTASGGRSKHRDLPETRGQYFVAESAQWKIRPVRGMVRGTQYLFDRPARKNIAPIAKSLGNWNYELPEGAHPDVYRPAFPAPLSAPAPVESAE